MMKASEVLSTMALGATMASLGREACVHGAQKDSRDVVRVLNVSLVRM